MIYYRPQILQWNRWMTARIWVSREWLIGINIPQPLLRLPGWKNESLTITAVVEIELAISVCTAEVALSNNTNTRNANRSARVWPMRWRVLCELQPRVSFLWRVPSGSHRRAVVEVSTRKILGKSNWIFLLASNQTKLLRICWPKNWTCWTFEVSSVLYSLGFGETNCVNNGSSKEELL